VPCRFETGLIIAIPCMFDSFLPNIMGARRAKRRELAVAAQARATSS
jgi:hypothetical protein